MVSYDKILKDSKEALADTKKKGQDAINELHDGQKKFYNDQYNAAIKDTNIGYEDVYQKNAVQKLINEKEIAEKNANLGLTDSGLNRTQQTAVQLSYANQKGKIDIAKQNALDTLSQNLAASIAGIEQSRQTALADWDYKIDSQAQNSANEQYNTDVEDERKRWETEYNAGVKLKKAEIEANAKMSEENFFELTDAEIEYCKNVIDEGGTMDEVLSYLSMRNKLPPNNADYDAFYEALDGILGINDEDLNESVVTPLKTGTIDNDSASKYQKFRIVEGDNFDVKVGDNTYRVENKGKVTDNDTIKKLDNIEVKNSQVFLYKGDVYLKYADVYFKLGATNRLFNWGQTPGYQNLLNALQQ